MARDTDNKTVLPLKPHSPWAADLPQSTYRFWGPPQAYVIHPTALLPWYFPIPSSLVPWKAGRQYLKAKLQPKETREEINAPSNYILYYKIDVFCCWALVLFVCLDKALYSSGWTQVCYVNWEWPWTSHLFTSSSTSAGFIAVQQPPFPILCGAGDEPRSSGRHWASELHIQPLKCFPYSLSGGPKKNETQPPTEAQL